MIENSIKLLHRVLDGEEEAFTELVQKYQKKIHALAWRKIGDYHIAEEITQDIFLQVYKNLPTLKNPILFEGWLYVVTNRLCLNWLKKNKVERGHLSVQLLEDTPPKEIVDSFYTQHQIEQREKEKVEHYQGIVKKLLEILPESERTVITLYYLGEMTSQEISKFLGVSVNTIKSRLHRARNRLKTEEDLLLNENLGGLQLSTNLTESILKQIADIKPKPQVIKPIFPWAALGASAILVILLMGTSKQFSANFQKPYSVDALSEPTIEIVNAPVVQNIQSKPKLQNQIGGNKSSKDSNDGLTKGTKAVENNLTHDAMQWNLPEDAKARLGKGHIDEIQYSPDGKFLAVASGIGIWLYDVTVHQEATLITADTSQVFHLAFSPDGSNLASGNADGNIILYNRITGTQKTLIGRYTEYITSLAFSPDGKILASCNRQGTIQIWDAITGEVKYTLMHDAGGKLSFTIDCNTIVVVSKKEGKISLWNSITGEQKKTFAMHPDCTAVGTAFSPNGKTVAVGSVNGTVYIYDLNTDELKMLLSEHKDHVCHLAFSSDGKMLATASFEDKTICLWDVHTGTHRKILTDENTPDVRGLAFSPDGKTLASGRGDGTIRFWDTHTSKQKKMFTGHSESVLSVAVNPNGDIIASGCNLGIIRLWNTDTMQPIRTLNRPKNRQIESANSIVFSSDGKTLFCGTGDGIHLWNAYTGEYKKTLTGHTDSVKTIARSSDGNILASGSRDNTIRLWDAHTGEHKRTLIAHKKLINSVAFSPDGKTLASGGEGGTVRLWDIATGKNKLALTGHKKWVESIAFSPDGKTLASGDGYGIIHLWDIDTGKTEMTLTLDPGTDWVYSLAFSPDGKTLASGCASATIYLWDVHTGEHKKKLMDHTAWVSSIAFGPDGKTLVSGSSNGSVLLWEIDP